MVACASGQAADDDDDQPDAPQSDARVDGTTLPTDAPPIDAPPIDAPPIDAPPIDARVIDALSIDALPIDGLPIDAPGCTTGTTQLLLNPALDLTPAGTGWVQMVFDPQFPLITTDTIPGVLPDTAPMHAYLGGYFDGVDSFEQTVTVPAGTTQLVLRGRRVTMTDEAPGSFVYDTSTVELTNAAGTLIENALTVTNLTPSAGWVAFAKTFAASQAGTTVKVRFRSSNDFSLVTHFFYDSLALDANVTCP